MLADKICFAKGLTADGQLIKTNLFVVLVIYKLSGLSSEGQSKLSQGVDFALLRGSFRLS